MSDTAETLPATVAAPAIAVRPKAELVAGSHVAPIVPRTIEEVARVANAVIIAGLAPDSYRGANEKETASRIMIGIMAGAELGMGPMNSLKNIAIIGNRPCLWGDGGVALIQNSGKVQKWEENYTGTFGQDDWTAHCVIWRHGQELPYEGHFSWADAKRARLVSKRPWQDTPQRMLMWRARTYCMRNGFADCLAGLSIVEEVRDLPVAPPAQISKDFLTDDAPVDAPAEPAEVTE